MWFALSMFILAFAVAAWGLVLLFMAESGWGYVMIVVSAIILIAGIFGPKAKATSDKRR